MIDDIDFEDISPHRWHFDTDGYVKRSFRTGKRVSMMTMHRQIMKAPKGLLVDHINFNLSDNRRSNLRLCTANQNQWNTKPRNKYKGLKKKGNGWEVYVTAYKKRNYIDSFKNETDASKAYNEAVKKYHGEFAYLNKV